MLTLTHHGAVTGVTGFCHELSLHGPGGAKAGVLVDCGIFQAAGTPGRDILTFGPRGGWVMLDGERHAIRAQIHQVGGYSAHAGQVDLLRFVAGIPEMPAEIRIVHGDDEAKHALKKSSKKPAQPASWCPTTPLSRLPPLLQCRRSHLGNRSSWSIFSSKKHSTRHKNNLTKKFLP
ncbi:MBL fold metallo-hydrolase RNA specificity domain-containing protein [Aromatoleum aromaticum]|nr:MBL fold metallo-hydrolase RNA specificity domain-containing protein [Aromatoleum aromaticum]